MRPEQRAARLIGMGGAVVAGAVLADSATEHYRGSFENRAMVLPLLGSALSLATDGAWSIEGGASRGAAPMAMSVHAASAGIGLAGLGFHAYNVLRQPGRLTFTNLFYQAPIGAPAALIVAGALGAAAQVLGRGSERLGPLPLGSGRLLAGFCALTLLGNSGEAALLHFRGAYHDPFMWLPVTLPPIAALALGAAAVTGKVSAITTPMLGVTAALGLIGAGFHIYGTSRNMGGWRNWRQNLLVGPPIPAPPSFTGIALAGLGAVLLMRKGARG